VTLHELPDSNRGEPESLRHRKHRASFGYRPRAKRGKLPIDQCFGANSGPTRRTGKIGPGRWPCGWPDHGEAEGDRRIVERRPAIKPASPRSLGSPESSPKGRQKPI